MNFEELSKNQQKKILAAAKRGQAQNRAGQNYGAGKLEPDGEKRVLREALLELAELGATQQEMLALQRKTGMDLLDACFKVKCRHIKEMARVKRNNELLQAEAQTVPDIGSDYAVTQSNLKIPPDVQMNIERARGKLFSEMTPEEIEIAYEQYLKWQELWSGKSPNTTKFEF